MRRLCVVTAHCFLLGSISFSPCLHAEPLIHSEPAFQEIKPGKKSAKNPSHRATKQELTATPQQAPAQSSRKATGKSSRKKKAETRKAIRELRSQIAQLNKSLRDKRESKNKTFQKLRELDTRIAKLSTRLDRNENSIARLQKKIAPLKRRKRHLSDEIELQREYLRKDIRLQFAMGNRGMITALLGQENHQSMQRALLYHNVIVDAREKRIHSILSKVDQYARIERSIKNKQDQLRKKRIVFNKEKAQYQKMQASYRQTVALLKKDIDKSQSTLTQLKSDQQELQQVLKLLRKRPRRLRVFVPEPDPPQQRRKVEVPRSLGTAPGPRSVPTYSGRFRSLRGKLIWPVQGKLVKRFNPARKPTEKYARGVLLAAPFGTRVQAVAAGRVIYASWLRGFGFVLIIDHGGNFMTLYGHNRSLDKSVGDRVKVGEYIATVGESGGISQAALYFEIRRKGVPLNPLRWCRKSMQAAQ